MADLVHDLRLSIRQLSRRPLFTATAVLTLAIGLGVNSVAFSVINGILFKSSAAATGPDVGRLLTMPGGDESGNASLAEYARFADATSGTLDLAAEGRSTVAWRHDGASDIAWVLYVTPNYFTMVDAAVLAGQLRVERTEDGTVAAVIGERFWRNQLGARSLAGLTLNLGGAEVSVAGVMKESFTGPAGLYSPDVWLPLDQLALFNAPAALQNRETRWLFLLGRLRPGAAAAEVQGRADLAAALMAREWPDTHQGRGARFRLLAEGNSELRGVSAAAAIGMGIIGLILLLACFNVANLLLARGVERERDMGIRTALGAKPSRLMRLVIVEGFVLAAASGVLALMLAWWTQALVSTFAIPIEVPQHIDVSPDGRVIVFIVLLICVAGVLPGLWPALAAARINVTRVLAAHSATAAGGRPSSLGRWLVGAQTAGSTAFLAIALLFIQSYTNLQSVDPGFARDHLLVAEFSPEQASSEMYAAHLVERAQALPGVVSVALADRAPFFIGFDRETAVWPDSGACAPDNCPRVATYAVESGYFATMGIALTAGRTFSVTEGVSEVVVNGAFARQQWPDGRGVGETLRIGTEGAVATVVGITADTQIRRADREQPAMYLPLTGARRENSLTLIVRTTGSPSALIRPLREAAAALDSGVPMLSLKTMTQRTEVQLWPFRTVSFMFTICGALALVLAVVGLAGLVIHAVSRRTREFGVRLSIGATPRDLIRDVMRDGAKLFAPGLLAGVVIAAGSARLVEAVFVGVNVLNPRTYVAVAVLQGLIVAVTCIAPAVRASRVDPLTTLRAD